MLKIYGAAQCPDCVRCKEELDKAGVEYLYLDIMEKMLFLKQFLKLREDPVFAPIRKGGQIGIPCILKEDGTLTFDWKEFL